MEIAAKAIVLAVIANTVVKSAMVLIGGAVSLKRAILPGIGLVLITAIVVVLITV